MQRQAFVYDPELKCSVHTYVDCGPGAAKPNHGHAASRTYDARGLGKVIVPKQKFSAANAKQNQERS